MGRVPGRREAFCSRQAARDTTATIIFAVLWFGVAAWNMWNGVSRAGYSVSEDLPIFFLIFLLSVVVALVVTWRFL